MLTYFLSATGTTRKTDQPRTTLFMPYHIYSNMHAIVSIYNLILHHTFHKQPCPSPPLNPGITIYRISTSIHIHSIYPKNTPNQTKPNTPSRNDICLKTGSKYISIHPSNRSIQPNKEGGGSQEWASRVDRWSTWQVQVLHSFYSFIQTIVLYFGVFRCIR